MLVVGSTRYERWQLAAEDDVLGCWLIFPTLTFVVDAGRFNLREMKSTQNKFDQAEISSSARCR
jgi:hypothetical protein